METKDRKTKFDYKWIIIALCFLMVFTCLGFCSSNRSLYIGAITDALSIKRAAFATSDSVRFIATAVINLFFGSLVQRFGTKKLICAGFICLILSAVVCAYATTVIGFCVGGVLLGLGLSWTTTTMVGCVVTKWSKENKGTIMGAILAANGLGGALAAQIVTPIIFDESNPFGYRNAYLLVALILACVGVLIVSLFRENPKNHDGSKTEIPKKKARGQSWVGIEFSQAVKKRFFYGALICIFGTGFIVHGVTGVSGAHMKDVGLDAGYIATMMSLHSIALTVFKFATGVIYDKFGLRVTVLTCCTAAIVTMLSLALTMPTLPGKIFAAVYSVIGSLALPLETIMLPIYAGDLFGEKSFNKIMGIFVSVNTAGYALSSIFINAIYDIYGSYNPGFIICAIAMVLVIIGLQFVINASHRLRKEVEAALEKETVTA